ncbi:hypothetical protein K488DRAFT_44749 [Vararia minispora EC-137]|uniref:Uncharacterized protein n=1 Tax=Vararia minispora EC-137 TaxID=1314806 RepID=A0ACB8QT16_9AGAM|nr:hypothetical protein K488DRAFT_44749 [Vararia minispora EC-137]
MHAPALLLSLACLLHTAIADFPSPSLLNQTCDPTHDRLNPQTYRRESDCDAQTYCAPATRLCTPRVCRQPFSPGDSDLPLCPDGQFCADAGDACRKRAPAGVACEFGRDEQCAAPWDAVELAGEGNADGAVCLNFACMFANATLGEPCVFEKTDYTSVLSGAGDGSGEGSATVVNTIVRDNCRTGGLFCNTQTGACESQKLEGGACQFHRDCVSYTCVENVCRLAPETPVRVPPWQYAVTSLSLILAMAATCVMLTLMHRRHRLQAYHETRDYCYEQILLRRSILVLRDNGPVTTAGTGLIRWRQGTSSEK